MSNKINCEMSIKPKNIWGALHYKKLKTEFLSIEGTAKANTVYRGLKKLVKNTSAEKGELATHLRLKYSALLNRNKYL